MIDATPLKQVKHYFYDVTTEFALSSTLLAMKTANYMFLLIVCCMNLAMKMTHYMSFLIVCGMNDIYSEFI